MTATNKKIENGVSLGALSTGITPTTSDNSTYLATTSFVQSNLTTYLGSTTIVTLGTITTGTWNGSTINPVYGGTGLTSYTTGDILYSSATDVLSKLPAVASGNALVSNGIGVAPSWGKIGLATHVTGILEVSNGGSGANTLTGVLIGDGTNPFTTKTNPTGDFVGTTDTQTLTNKTLTSPRIVTNILDTNGNELLVLNPITSAVNEITVTNATTGNTPSLTASGNDTNISFNIASKGTGNVLINSNPVISFNNGWHTTATGTITTTSTTDVLVTGMSISPPAGTYLVSFYSSTTNSNNNRQIFFTVYVGGSPITNSLLTIRSSSSSSTTATPIVNFPVTVTTGQSVEIYWRTSANTATLYARRLTLLRVG